MHLFKLLQGFFSLVLYIYLVYLFALIMCYTGAIQMTYCGDMIHEISK